MEKKPNTHRKTPENRIERLKKAVRSKLGRQALNNETVSSAITPEDIYSGMEIYKAAKAKRDALNPQSELTSNVEQSKQ